MAAAVPFALKAGIPLAASFLGKKLSGPSPQQRAAMTGTQQAGEQVGAMAPPLMQQGTDLTQQGGGYLRQGSNDLSQAGRYYSNILSNRRAATNALAPEMTTAMDFYRGAGQKVQRTMRGGSRDYAQAELDRQKVGQLASYLPQARAGAAQGMERIGSAQGALGGTAIGGGASLTGQGVNAASNAAYINSGLFNQATQLQQQQGAGGKAFGSLLYDIAQMIPWGKKAPLSSSRVPGNFYTGLPTLGAGGNQNISGKL